jgi:hypothetical protein
VAREFLPPEQAESWGEFNARLELELEGQRDLLTPVWSAVAGLLFGMTLIGCAYAFTDRHWWLWVGWLALLAVVLAMAARGVRRADSRRARAIELARLRDAWQDHLDRESPTR